MVLLSNPHQLFSLFLSIFLPQPSHLALKDETTDRDVVGVEHRAPDRHELGEDGRLALQQGLHQAEEVQVHHLSQHLHHGLPITI